MTSNVLMVLDYLGTGGTETYVLSISKPFLASKARLFYAGADGPFHQEFSRAGFHIHLVESKTQPLHIRRQTLQRAYRTVMEQQDISIVHVHQTPSGLLAAAAARELNIPVVFTLHGTYYPQKEAIELAQLCDAIISVSKPVQRYWNAFGISSTVISNGVDLEKFQPAAKTDRKETALADIPDQATVVTYVSRLAWQKASVCNMVLRATKTLPEMQDLHIVVVGTGAQEFHVKELARNLNKLKKRTYVHVVGEQTDVMPYYRRSDLVIGTGRVALEAMACGKPVLAIGNHGYLGLVTPENYEKAWDYYFGDHDSAGKPSLALIAEALQQALCDRERLRVIGEQGREWVRSRFDIAQKGREILALYERVRQGKGKRTGAVRKILYVGWIGFNNLGDELMWKVFEQLSHKHLDANQAQVIPSLPGVDLVDLSPYDTVVLGGGSLLVPGYANVAHRAVQQQKRLLVWGSGYDTQQPVQIDSAGRLLESRFGESDKMRQMLREIGRHATFFGVRGPLTYQYLQAAGVEGRLAVSGDPGMLLLPLLTDESPARNQEPVIGINWGTSYNRIYGKNEATVEDALATAARQLIEDGCKLYIYTMWGPDREANKRLCQKIGVPHKTTLDLDVHSHTELMRRLQKMDATINFKLHANVLSAACGVPFVCLGYRFKCFDFTHSLDVSELTVATDEQDLGTRLLNRVRYALEYREAIRHNMAIRQQQMIRCLEEPFLQGLL